MPGLTVLIADDEPLARSRLLRLLGRLEWVGQIIEASDVGEARRQIEESWPDILLLDIQMPGGSGFDVMEGLGPKAPAVVFVTAFDHHALRAFDANALDYLTKPVDAGRFGIALERARVAVESRQQIDRVTELQETIAALKRALGQRERAARDFWVKVRDEHLRVAQESILRFQAEGDYVRIHASGAQYLYQDSLAALERRLDPDEFMRIHRGHIVRRDAIVRIRPAPFAALVVTLRDGAEIRVGRTYTAWVRNAFCPR
ncbi:MAG: LytTR family DNA-binding domain-containing protein [Zoogloea sp.]|uniref:LytR/AlgR family response regulator transcription factor n=1 Tax=Zoogloea sp. TaxID=49181 RepID=UPI0026356B0C|nr:LytTR family DNA-binding domain-containing protein [Zoogloea sp.]MDD2988441.1 LytTR family DNA-binding domain-containing protein [Zoogloea sp.]